MLQSCSNIFDERRRSKTSMAAAKEIPAVEFDSWKNKHNCELIWSGSKNIEVGWAGNERFSTAAQTKRLSI